jgi:hypothetical protein
VEMEAAALLQLRNTGKLTSIPTGLIAGVLHLPRSGRSNEADCGRVLIGGVTEALCASVLAIATDLPSDRCPIMSQHYSSPDPRSPTTG